MMPAYASLPLQLQAGDAYLSIFIYAPRSTSERQKHRAATMIRLARGKHLIGRSSSRAPLNLKTTTTALTLIEQPSTLSGRAETLSTSQLLIQFYYFICLSFSHVLLMPSRATLS